MDASSQFLYLDCDTFFFDDVESLFHTYAGHDWNAREETLSRRSHYGYNPSHIDESTLESIARRERLQLISPFNSGVCLLNNHVRIGFDRVRVNFLDLAWRLLVGRELATGGTFRKSIYRFKKRYWQRSVPLTGDEPCPILPPIRGSSSRLVSGSLWDICHRFRTA